MSAVATLPSERQSKSVLLDMADRFGMEPLAFEATVRATCMPAGKEQSVTREQFAAFLLVAKEYGLNPILKEIFAFPTRSGGIQPVVSIDGWMNLINSHPQLDGLEFDDHGDTELSAITARIWRKDRSKPIVVTEYMIECKRATDTWKQWPRRMLRHKAAIQCARYAFGFAGIIDPDEAERMADVSQMRDVNAVSPPKTIAGKLDILAAESSQPNVPAQEADAAVLETEPATSAPQVDKTTRMKTARASLAKAERKAVEPAKWFEDIITRMRMAPTLELLTELWESDGASREEDVSPNDFTEAEDAYQALRAKFDEGEGSD